MQAPLSDAVDINVVLSSMRVQGRIAVDSAHRVSDFLNAPTEAFQIVDVTVTTPEGTRVETYSELFIEKRHVLAVIPRETEEYLTSHRLARFGISGPGRAALGIALVLPPFNVLGVLHITPPLEIQGILSRVSRFFPLTNAMLYLNRMPVEEDMTLLINRDQVVGVGPSEEGGTRPPQAAAPQQAERLLEGIRPELLEEFLRQSRDP